MNRRGFLQSILAAGVAPAFVGASVLMPVRKLWTPQRQFPYTSLPAAYLVSWSVSNNGSADLTLQGIEWSDFYTPVGDLIIRPGEAVEYDYRTRVYSMKRASSRLKEHSPVIIAASSCRLRLGRCCLSGR